MGRLVDLDDILAVVQAFFDECQDTPERDAIKAEFIGRINKVETYGSWSYIGRSHKLPPIGKNVLTYGQNGGLNMASLITDANGEIVWRRVGKTRSYLPKAWMYVPKLEEEEESAELR